MKSSVVTEIQVTLNMIVIGSYSRMWVRPAEQVMIMKIGL